LKLVPGYLLIQTVLYLCITSLLALCIIKFCATMIAVFKKEGEATAAKLRLQTALMVMDRALWQAPSEMSNWLVQQPDYLVWKNSLDQQHLGLQYAQKKIWYLKGTYNELEQRWTTVHKQVISHDIERCCWIVKTHQLSKTSVPHVALIMTELEATANQKPLPASAVTTLSSRVLHG
jgi:hypothetical protein